MKEYDVVIIGGGIAGALTAYKLSENRNLSILILEAGADRSHERTSMSLAYAYSTNKSPGSPYNKNPHLSIPFPDATGKKTSDYYQYASTSGEFKSTYLKIAGGTTWHFLGNVPRFVPSDFQLSFLYGRGDDWPIKYEDLEKHYGEAEFEMGVSCNSDEWREIFPGATRSSDFPMPEIWPSYSDRVIKPVLQGSSINGKTITIRSTPQARNSQAFMGRPACAGNSSCVPICPIQAKYDATVHLKKAIANNVEVSYQSIVVSIERGQGELISQVRVKKWGGAEEVVKGKVFILATHAVESALLLQVSKLCSNSKAVGKYLMDHPQGYGVAITNEPVFPFRGPPTTSGIDVFRDGEFRKEHAAFRISLGNDGWGRWKGEDKLETILKKFTGDTEPFLIGKELRKAIEDIGVRLFRFSYSTEMLPMASNTVTPHQSKKDPVTGLPWPELNFQIDEPTNYSQKAFSFASDVLIQMFNKLGIASENYDTISSTEKFSGAGHIMGTTRMGTDNSKSVVDKDCRTHDHKNLFLIGPGVFTTGGTANPTLTVAALAIRLANTINDEFKNRAFS